MPTSAFFRLSVFPITALALAGCAAVGPDHETPAMDLPASFSQGGVKWNRESTDSQPTPRPWWTLYRDPTLNSLVDRALSGNQNLRAAAANLEQARAMSRAARTLFFPDIDLGAGAERSKMRMRMPGGGTTVMNSFTVPVDMAYELDVWGKVRRQIEGAEASEGAAAESLNAMRLSIAGEVTQTYWALRAVDADRMVLDHTLEIRRRALGLLEKRHDAGTTSGLDYSRAENEVASAEADRIQLDQQRVQLVNALAVLCGSVATGSSVPEKPELPQPPSIPSSVPSDLLRQRPDIRAAEHRVAAANADIGVATAAFYPAFRINASSGFDSSTLNDLFQASSLVWSLGANATLPITERSRLSAQRDATVAAHEAASADYRQTVLEAVREVEDSLQGTTILARRQEAQDKAVTAARKTFDLSTKQYNSGLISFLDVVDAERTRLDAERAANAIRAERLAMAASLAKAIGGGW